MRKEQIYMVTWQNLCPRYSMISPYVIFYKYLIQTNMLTHYLICDNMCHIVNVILHKHCEKIQYMFVTTYVLAT